MRSLLVVVALFGVVVFACIPSGVPNACGCSGGSTCGACPQPAASFSQDAYVAPGPPPPPPPPPAPLPAPLSCATGGCGYPVAAPAQAPISYSGTYGSYVPPPPPPLPQVQNQYPTLIQPNYQQQISYNSIEQQPYVDQTAKVGYVKPLPIPQPQVSYLPAPPPAQTPEPSQYLPEYESIPSANVEPSYVESKENYKPNYKPEEEVFKAGRLDNYGTVPEYHVKVTESVYDTEVSTEEYLYTTPATKIIEYTEPAIYTAAIPEATSQEYAAVLKEREEEEKVDFNYMTYYNQVCTGETLGTSKNETTASAAEKCAVMECAAANARPQGNGRYEVVFLKSVDGRLNQQGTYCVSGINVPLRENPTAADANETSPGSFKKPKSVDARETLSDAEMAAKTRADQVVGANGRRRSPMRVPMRIQNGRFATVEPKSRRSRIY
ncbi:hypothetical protein L596_007689 [Steinernema carpocapsae]|uniref:Ground-like domain-containing protein n=1 Tax=Steinernema carpocapsae TaxID=34508 RepID=A0A4U5PA73_STECR|nr:hypothetical protein L596_007689 [Steinernema carpocapsae]